MRGYSLRSLATALSFLLLGSVGNHSEAQIPQVVRDINPIEQGSDPSGSTLFHGSLFFTATEAETGNELWKTDGTEAGTFILRDIAPGTASSSPSNFVVMNETLFFFANGYLWKTDGTPEGTLSVSSISNGSPSDLTNVNGTLFYATSTNANVHTLWKSDGTGTMLVKIFNLGLGSHTPMRSLTNLNGTLLFVLDDGVLGGELWKSDGTEAGTVLLKDINPGKDPSYPSAFTPFNGMLYFSADDGSTGYEFWRTDGTAAGTLLVKDIRPEPGAGSGAIGFTEIGSTLFLRADDGVNGSELWKSDGTEAGTALVRDIFPGESGSIPRTFRKVNDTLFFGADDGVHGVEFWKSDGTTAGTVLVRDVNPGPEGSDAIGLNETAAVRGELYFFAQVGQVGLWRSDGTEVGTSLVKVMQPGGSFPTFVEFDGALLFGGDDGVLGGELWKSDGTESGTVLVKNIQRRSEDSSPRRLTNVNGTLFFTAKDGVTGEELWRSDGTEAGTYLVKDIRPGPESTPVDSLVGMNGYLYFAADDGINGDELWRSDGTEAGTFLLKDINPGPADGLHGFNLSPLLTAVDGTLFFQADEGVHGLELWKSDGTEAGTHLVKDINPGPGLSNVDHFGQMNGMLFFRADNGTTGFELWKSDGTEAGTVLVRDLNPGSSFVSSTTHSNGWIFFVAYQPSVGVELWKTDGSEAGTVLVKDICPGPEDSLHYVTDLVDVNGTLFFPANDGVNGIELWKSDGTEDGTVLVKDIFVGEESSLWFLQTSMFNLNGTLFFPAWDGVNGVELWKSDGTAAGTVLVKDIRTDQSSSFPDHFAAAGEHLYFNADDNVNGIELWRSDGTKTGTVLVDLYPQGDSDPRPVSADGSLFVAADDFLLGRELWVFPGQFEIFRCESQGDTVKLSWSIRGPVSNIEILRDGVVIATLAGEATSYVDQNPEFGFSQYRVAAVNGDAVTHSGSCRTAFELAVGQGIGSTGESVPVPVYLNFNYGGGISGFSFAVCHTPDNVEVRCQQPNSCVQNGIIVPGADLQPLNGGTGPQFFSPSPVTQPHPGWTVGCIFHQSSMISLSPQTGAELVVATYQVRGRVGDEDTLLTVCVTGDPPVEPEIVLASGGQVITPVTRSGGIMPPASMQFIRGDCNGDGIFNGLIDMLFCLEAAFIANGPQPPCDEAADVDGDGVLNFLVDVLFGLNCVFTPGQPCPPSPFPECGPDPDSPESLGCEFPGRVCNP